MTTSAVGSTATTSSTASTEGMSKAFRQADFLKIMLTEITNQSPFDPTDTGKMVENMQKLQELANTTYTKFRSDLGWAQDLIGQQVNVQQAMVDEVEKKKLTDKGVDVDAGFGSVNGTVSSYRVVDETVWVRVRPTGSNEEGKEYPIDNVKQITPSTRDPGALATVAANLLGRKVDYWKDEVTDRASGTVSDVSWGTDGQIMLKVGSDRVAYEHLVGIGTAP